VLALRWSDIDLEAGAPTRSITGTINNEPATGTHRKPIKGVRTVLVPELAVLVPELAVVLLHRRRDTGANRIGAVFPTRNGTWQPVTNVEPRWSQIRKDMGLEWVVADAFRRFGTDGLGPPDHALVFPHPPDASSDRWRVQDPSAVSHASWICAE
jgi:integrase